jgi:glycosyl transferase family 25
MSSSIEIRVINLERSKDRLELISHDLDSAGLQWSRLEAIEPDSSSALDHPLYRKKRANYLNERDLTRGEIGCFLSHLAALKDFLDGAKEYLLVLEDDVLITSSAASDFLMLPKLFEGRLGRTWHCANLTVSYHKRFRPLFDFRDLQVRRAFYFPMLSSALFWNRQGARDFVQSIMQDGIYLPVDDQLRSHLAKTGFGLSLSRPLFELRSLSTTIALRPTGGRSSHLVALRKKFPNYFYAFRNQLLFLFT